MKKLSYICMALLLGLGMTGCSDNAYDGWADPLSSGQESLVTIDGLKAYSTGTIDLNRAGSTVAPCTMTTANMPEGYSITSINLTLTPESDGAQSTDVQTVTLDANCLADSAALQDAATKAYGLAPTVRQFKGKVTPTITNGKSTVMVDAGTVDVYVTPAYQAAPLYWLVGAVNGWGANNAGKNICYVSKDSPTTKFSYTCKWTGDRNLKIWATDFIGSWENAWGGIDGDESASGSLNLNGGAFKAPSEEYYTLTIDMANHTYSWTKLENQNPTEYSKIGMIGDFNSWSGDLDMQHASDGNVHNWYVKGAKLKKGTFKFRANGAWDIAWGSNDKDSEYYEGTSGSLTRFGEGRIGASNENLTIPADATYSVYFNDITGQFVLVPEF